VPQHRRMPQPHQGLYWPRDPDAIDRRDGALIRGLEGWVGRQHQDFHLAGVETDKEVV
jgi:hypothetical protein